jgi:hypothetical protein
VLVAPGFDAFGDAAPCCESASGRGRRAEGAPEFVAGVAGGGDDAFGPGDVEGVTDVGQGRGVVCLLVGGGSHGRRPGGDGLPFLGDVLPASCDNVHCPGEVGARGVESYSGPIDDGPVASAPPPATGLRDRAGRLGELAVERAALVLLAAEVGPCTGEGVAAVWWQTRGQLPEVVLEGGVSGTQTVGTEGDGVVGAHGSQDDLGPVVRQGVVDLVDAVETPAVGMVPGRSGRGGLIQTGDVGAGSAECMFRSFEAAAGTGERIVGASDLVASASPEPR